MQDRIRAWINEHLVKGFYRAHSWLLNLFGFLVVVLPDILNYAVSNIDSFVGSIPTLSIQHKLTILAAVNVLSLVVKAWKQKNGPIAIAERETVAATEIFVDGSIGADHVKVPQDSETQAIIRQIQQHLADDIRRGSGDIGRAMNARFGTGPDQLVTRNVYATGGIARETAGIIGEDGPEAVIPVRRNPDGSLSTDGTK